jgi:hypothetical protein
MSINRYAKRADLNQTGIVQGLRSIPGVSVQTEHNDILVGFRNKTFWFEIKSENSVSKKTGKVLQSRKRGSQIVLEKNWAGHYSIVSSIDEILIEIGVTK